MSFLSDLATHLKTWANLKFAPITGSSNYEPKNSNIQNHISTTGNPHATTKTDIGLGNVTNDAQIKKQSSSVNGNIPIWNGTTGDALGNGYGVETTLAGNSSNLVRADAVKAAIDALGSGTGNAIHVPVQDLAACKALDTTNATTFPDKLLMLIENLGLYRLDRDSSATGDDNGVIQPTTGVGRWIKLSSPTDNHNLQSGLQGGTTNEYYHLTSAYYAALAGTNGIPSGINKFVTASDGRLSQLTTSGTLPVGQIDVLSAEWTAFDNTINS